MIDSKINVLDSLRAFTTLSVCLYHFVCTTTGYVTNRWILDIFSVGKFGCGLLFFVISGFVPKTPKPHRNLINKYETS